MASDTNGFEKFCGGIFWDYQLSWNATTPDFTSCFLRTAVVWPPCFFLWLTLPVYAVYLHSEKGPSIPVNKLNTAKTVLSIILVLLGFLGLVEGSTEYANEGAAPVALVSPTILLLTMVLATVLIQIERQKGFITSGIMFLFWVSSFVLGLFPLYSYSLRASQMGYINDVFRFSIFIPYYAVIIAQLILSCICEKTHLRTEDATKKPSPEASASFLSRITFWWISGLVYVGYKKSLEESDLWELHPRDLSKYNGPVLEKAWHKELVQCNRVERKVPSRSRGISSYQNGPQQANGYASFSHSHSHSRSGKKLSSSLVDVDEKTPLMSSTDEAVVEVQTTKKKTPSFLKVISLVYGWDLFTAQLCKLVYDIIVFTGPILQGYLISYTEDPYMAQWKGFLFAFGFFFCGVVQSLFFHQLFHIGMTCGMRMKSAVIAVVYKKALTMSNEARKNVTVGEIVNLMSVDAQRLQDVAGYIWMVWSSPLQIAIAVYMLWGTVGPSVLTGLAVMILLIPINGVMATFQRKLQISQMTQKDQRIKLMNEVLNGIKVLKLYAWELSFKEKINVIREIELETLKKYSYLSAFGTFTWTCAPFIVTLATFGTYVATGHTLDANTAFVSLSLFNILRFPINLLPMMISYLVTASVSIKRIGKFLAQGEIDFTNTSHDPSAEDPIVVENGTFSWGRDDDDLTILNNINFNVKDGSLVGVVGTVGCGKSSLISAILGEMEKLDGHVNVRGRIAYVPQQAWIQNATLKENVLFGKRFSKNKYENVINDCALKPDLEILPGGDQVEIGEKGINLSGGQKQRISLARAVYNDADIYLLDDPLSAVDAHVGKHIFEKVISNETGALKGKTRILITHGLHWLPKVDKVVVMEHGCISEMGTYDELLQHNGAFAQLAKQYLIQELDSDEELDSELEDAKKKLLERVESVVDEDSKKLLHRLSSIGSPGTGTDSETPADAMEGRKSSIKSRKFSRSRSMQHEPAKPVTKEGEKLTVVEKAETGEVKYTVFLAYAKALGYINALFIVIFFLCYQVASVLSNLWLSEWTEDDLLKNMSLVEEPIYDKTQNKYLGIYGGLGAIQAMFVLMYSIVTAYSMVHAARELHCDMLTNILRSPMSFFDTTPIGRILNRFSRDVETIDNLLPQLFRSWFNTMFTVISTVFVISFSTPLFLAVVIPLGLLYYFIQRFYIPTSRQLKRVESTTRSPIYTHFSETITGASTIRAYAEQPRFIGKSDALVDHNLVFYFASIASNRWLGVRLEFMGSAVVLAAAMFAVLGKGTISGGLVGLSISYALQVTQSLNWMVRMSSDLESNVVSVERVKEYSETPREAAWYIDSTSPPRAWPDQGKVAFENYDTRYREGLDLVLKGITLNIAAGEKVGIVGRTGAGKSSLTLALFRLIECAQGSIVIDGLQVQHLGLHQLRSRLTILPQDPVLFSGSLRMNLDPFGKYSDGQIWQALEQAHLKEFVDTLPAGLDYECGEGGMNLSVGQRQLVCLARTLLRKTKILILDEATAAVDLETDELIQDTIRSKFSECTILTIAHRLNTIMDNDRVLVLDAGCIAEFDNPQKLLDDKASIFFGMAKDAGLVS